MFAKYHQRIGTACFFAISAVISFPSLAQEVEKEESGVNFDLTQAAEPDSKAWEDPARISFTIDPNGKDAFSAQVNAEFKKLLSNPETRERSLTAGVVWNRETSESARQNNFEAGFGYEVGYATTMLDRTAGSDADEEAKKIDLAYQFGLAFARTANYGDPQTAPCVLNPLLRQCGVEFAESIRASASANVFNTHFENIVGGVGFTFEPQIGAAFDYRINNPVNIETGVVAKGSYGSISGGVVLKVVPAADMPDWEIKLSAKLRQALFVSTSREDEIKKTAETLKAGLTYYFVKPSEASKWRAGFGVEYSRGGDPLTGNRKADAIVFALRIGKY
jgi:hypothetical protein